MKTEVLVEGVKAGRLGLVVNNEADIPEGAFDEAALKGATVREVPALPALAERDKTPLALVRDFEDIADVIEKEGDEEA